MHHRRSTVTRCVFGASATGLLLWLAPLSAQESDSGVRAPQSAPKVHSRLARLALASADPVKAWVFFTDKGYATNPETDEALRAVERSYNDRAANRRAIRGDIGPRGGRLFDERDLPVARDYVQRVGRTGARVHVTSRWLNAVSVKADHAQLEAIARLPFVRAMQPVARSRRIDNQLDIRELGSELFPRATKNEEGGLGALDYGLSTGQLEQISLIALHDSGATGAGVVIGVLDTGFRRDHMAFNHPEHPLNVIAEYDFIDNDPNAGPEAGDPSAQHVHGTLILGEMAAYLPGELVGGAYDAAYILCKTEDTTDEYQAEEDNYVAGLEFIEANGGDVVNSSLGYIDWYTQDDLDGMTAVTTIAVNTAIENGLFVCTSPGNNGNDNDPTSSHLLAPADAFDVFACGAVDDANDISSFSSDGPTADGRVKPEVLARGVDTFTISANDPNTYNAVSGTSASAPLVTSAVACLVQAHPDWSISDMRDALIRTAADFITNGTHDPLFVRGYGVINAFAAGVDCNFNSLADVCDIDCAATSGACNVPGCGGSDDCNANSLPDECEPDCNANGVADECDIADCDPNDADCQDCNRNRIPDACEDPFPQQGLIELDQSTYNCQSTVTIVVSDCGLNILEDQIESVVVTAQSDSDPSGEPVELIESGEDTGAFLGSVMLSSVDAPGALWVAHADTVTATYTDADDGMGQTDVQVSGDADVDCSPPIVSNMEADVTGPFGATITFDTDEPATATVRYGMACGALVDAESEVDFATSFSIPLTDLTATTTYYFAIEVEDQWTNATTFDNGGQCYTFETPEIPNYFTEHFTGNDNDLDFRSIQFTPDDSVDVYAPCTYEILSLPTDPEGGIVLNMSNDFVPITLPGGATITHYGIEYSTFYVGGHGYITFGEGDDESWDTLEHHFELPRIAALFELIDPDEGTISYKLLADRVAVTWWQVPSFFQENDNTFQIEMFFDGRIRISYLTVDDDDGLAGLSAGTGVVPNFMETDLSASGPCGPQPPAAQDGHASTEMNTPVDIQLTAVDDGMPDPPGELTYVITTLPDRGVLIDPSVGPIGAAPYALSNPDGLVAYVPDTWYSGPDGFAFNVNDGGAPPDGGDSNTADVTISVGSKETIYFFDMESDPQWTTEGQWAFGQPTGGGSHNGDPTSGFTGANVYGYNLFGDYTDNLPPTHLTTTSMDCARLHETEVRYQRWLGVEYANYDRATLSGSNDVNSWVVVWDHEGGDLSDSEWVAQAFDISDIADGEASVRLRWTMGPTDFILTFPGWNIDDVEIRAIVVRLPGDLDDNGVVDLIDFELFDGCFTGPGGQLSPECARSDFDLDGDADFADLRQFQLVFGETVP